MLDLSKLNPEQREAVTASEGPLLVVAGPGSGKTAVIAARVAYLVDQGLADLRVVVDDEDSVCSGHVTSFPVGGLSLIGRRASSTAPPPSR